MPVPVLPGEGQLGRVVWMGWVNVGTCLAYAHPSQESPSQEKGTAVPLYSGEAQG